MEEGKWKVGDSCMAPYSDDGALYAAIIRRTWEEEDGDAMAEVWFQDYSSDDNEVVKLTNLRAISTKADSSTKRQKAKEEFTSPLLNYISEAERIGAQYADMYSDTSPRLRTIKRPGPDKVPKSRTKVLSRVRKRKGTVAVGGAVKNSPGSKDKSVNNVSRGNKSTASPSIHETAEEMDERDFSGLNEGFSCMDVEKPSFPGKSAVGSKDPFVLSAPGEQPTVQVPGTINRYLRDYQREGVQFMYGHYKKCRGAILGDDMGLGKTVQVISLISAVLGKTGGKKDIERRLPEFLQRESPETGNMSKPKIFLIICPNSVLFNWLDEFETWTHCLVAKYHGKERDETLRRAQRGRLDAVITTFETYRLYLDDLLTVEWEAVFADEVHKIKEPGALITQALRRVNTKRRFGLSGTALQNKMAELWCVLDWANPGCLGGWKVFREEYEKVISAGQRYNANKRELADARQVAKRFSHIRSKWMIRRTKAIIAHQLPTKDENVVFCNLSSLQLAVYRALLESPDMTLVLKQKEPCDCGSGAKRANCCYKRNKLGEGIKSLTFGFMSLLIKVSNHIALLMPDATSSEKQRAKARHYCDIAFAKHPQFVELSREARFATLSDPSYCGKMQVLEKLLVIFKREKNKVLLFSSYTRLLDIIEMFLKTTYYTYRRLDGKTSMQDRQTFVHEFNKDPEIFLFLISTKAGGVGLNLTGANVVVIFDPNWNPTHDLQAQDRAYRIGQHRDVRVFRLISRGSIEENMYLRQMYKQQLASVAVTTENAKRYFTAVAGNRDHQGEIFGLHRLFALRVDGSLTKDVIQREERTELGITMAKYQPVTSASKAKDPEEELLTEDEGGDGMELEDDEDDEDDVHGMASQIDEIVSEDGDDNDDDDDDDESDPFANRHPRRTVHKPNQLHEISESDSDQAEINDYDAETEESGAKEVAEEPQKRQARGKALIGRDGHPVCKVKGRQSGVGRAGGVGDKTARLVDENRLLYEGRDMGREPAGSRKQSLLQRNDSEGIRTVDDVFKKCGVTYIHSNQKVIGGSHIEDHVSEVAVRDVFERGQFSQEPAYCQVPTLAVESTDSSGAEAKANLKGKKRSLMKKTPSEAASYRLGDSTILVGQTPLAIKRDQFKEMASILEYESLSALSRNIKTLSEEDCRRLLLDFYQKKYGQCFGEFIKPPEQPKTAPTKSGGKNTVGLGKGLSERVDKGSKSEHQGRNRLRGNARMSRRRGVCFGGEDSDSMDQEFLSVPETDSDSDDDIEFAFRTANRTANVRWTKGQNSRKVTRRSMRGTSRTGCNIKMGDHHTDQGLCETSSKFKKAITPKSNSLTSVRTKQSNKQQEVAITPSTTQSRSSGQSVVNHDTVMAKAMTVGEEAMSDKLQGGPTGKREHSLSFLDDIFLTSSKTAKRKPPPKKANTRHNRTVLSGYDESSANITAQSMVNDRLTFDLEVDQGSEVKDSDLWLQVKDSDKAFKAKDKPVGFPAAQSKSDALWDCKNESQGDEEASLWKRNDTFVPRQTFLPESDDTDDSPSLFAVNTKFKGSCRDIEFT